MTDSIPIVSQIKSIVQLLFGEKEQAYQTQVNFIDSTAVLSQLKSAYQVYNRDFFDAIRTQRRFLIVTSATFDNIPIIGHIKGVGHYAIGHIEEGNNAMIDSTRSTVVILSAYFACVVMVPTTASASTTITISSIASMIGGAAVDGLVYIFDTFFKEESKIQQRFNKFKKIVGYKDKHEDDEYSVGDYFDMIVGPLLDGLIGGAIGYKMYQYRNGLIPTLKEQVINGPIAKDTVTTSKLPPPPLKPDMSSVASTSNIPLPSPWNPMNMIDNGYNMIDNLKNMKKQAVRYGGIVATLQRHADKELDDLFDDD